MQFTVDSTASMLVTELATIARELGQVRKEAAAACDLCAGMWLGSHPLKALRYRRAFFVFEPSFILATLGVQCLLMIKLLEALI